MNTRVKEVKPSLDAPFGVKRKVATPWNDTETAMVVINRGFGTKKESYAMIDKPKTNPHVAFSVFRLNVLTD